MTAVATRKKKSRSQSRVRTSSVKHTRAVTPSGIRYRVLNTPTGPFALLLRPNGEIQTRWVDDDDDLLPNAVKDNTVLPSLAKKLSAYFAGTKVDFSDISTPAGSAFFAACWRACRKIPRGQTISYGELAERAGSPGAARAAGQAMRNNPLPIVVPCHRVIGTSGNLHGFGGTCDADSPELGRKRLLLQLESKRSR
jgi:methylated-DNA-[protein]-cysteine S-methyltransferase